MGIVRHNRVEGHDIKKERRGVARITLDRAKQSSITVAVKAYA